MKGTKPVLQIERFTIRLPEHLVEAIDKARAERPGVVSRRSWIEEAVVEKLEAEGISAASLRRKAHA